MLVQWRELEVSLYKHENKIALDSVGTLASYYCAYSGFRVVQCQSRWNGSGDIRVRSVAVRQWRQSYSDGIVASLFDEHANTHCSEYSRTPIVEFYNRGSRKNWH